VEREGRRLGRGEGRIGEGEIVKEKNGAERGVENESKKRRLNVKGEDGRGEREKEQ
jgi:hypothetical protein